MLSVPGVKFLAGGRCHVVGHVIFGCRKWTMVILIVRGVEEMQEEK